MFIFCLFSTLLCLYNINYMEKLDLGTYKVRKYYKHLIIWKNLNIIECKK